MTLRKVGLGFFLLFLVAGVVWFLSSPERTIPADPESALAPVEVAIVLPYSGPSGNEFLLEHGLPSSTAVNDLILVGRVIEGLTTFFKNLDTRYVATNEQLSDFLTGANPEGLEYLDPEQPIFQDGLLTDRWGHPYIVHPLAAGILEIRSIGPDGIPYTEDDLRVNPDDRIQGN